VARVGRAGNVGASEGGGIWIDDATEGQLTNVTIAANSAHEGDGSGVFNDGSLYLTLANTLIARNLGDDDFDGLVRSESSNNLIGNGERVRGISNGSGGNLIGDDDAVIDARLSDLQDHGGATLTHRLFEGSPAIDSGNRDAAPLLDQRGVARPLQSAVDVGAFEAQRRLSIALPDGGGEYRVFAAETELVIDRLSIGLTPLAVPMEVFRYEFAALERVTINASSDSDRLIVDRSAGPVLVAEGIVFVGVAAAGDSIEIVGGASAGSVGSAATVTYELNGPGFGVARIDGLPVAFENVLAVTDSSGAVNRIVQFGSADDVARLEAGSVPGTGTGFSQVTFGAATVAFRNPTSRLEVNGGAGNDSLTVGGLDAGLVAAGSTIVIAGELGDDVVDASLATRGLLLFGGDGVDRLIGGTGHDTVSAGAGNDSVWGNDGNDVLLGDDGDDLLYGNAGDDTVRGGNGNDRMYGSSGRDDLDGEAGDDKASGQGSSWDTLRGGLGNDSLSGGAGRDIVIETANVDLQLRANRLYGLGIDRIWETEIVQLIGGAGNNVFDATEWNGEYVILDGGDGDDTLLGSPGPDVLDGQLGDDSISGNDGDDRLFGFYGSDLLSGDDGNDFINGQGGDDSLLGGAGDDRIIGADGNDIVSGGDGNDSAFGDNGIDTLIGDAGDDWLHGGDGGDLLDGGDDNDSLEGSDGEDRANGGLGNDTLRGDTGADRLFGDDGADLIDGGDGGDDLHGGTGDDTIEAGSGNDGVFGDDGDDWLYGRDGNDIVSGDRGNDYLNGGNEDDTLLGREGDDKLHGSAGRDLLLGEAGDDELDGQGYSFDTLSGGAGVNSLNTRGGTDIVDETANFTAGFDPESGTLTVFGIAGSRIAIRDYFGNVLLTVDGRPIADASTVPVNVVRRIVVQGSAGDDFVDLTRVTREMFTSFVEDGVLMLGGPGHDTLIGSEFHDSIEGNSGNDSIRGNDGLDTLRGNNGDDTLYGDRGEDLLTGDAGNDWLDGGDNADVLEGGDGDDILRGRSGNDTLSGGAGNDGLAGHRGHDFLKGDHGDDTLLGGDDNDSLLGGAGRDTLLGESGNDVVRGQGSRDVLAGGHGFGVADPQDEVIGDASEIDENFVFTADWLEDI